MERISISTTNAYFLRYDLSHTFCELLILTELEINNELGTHSLTI